MLETIPEGWSAGQPAAVLVHGVAGCARAPYIRRVALRLVRLGVRVVRMNLRGAGSGFGLGSGGKGGKPGGTTEEELAALQKFMGR